MIKIESTTLEGAYEEAASSLECSVTELVIEVVQYPSNGFLGLFRKTAIIVAAINTKSPVKQENKTATQEKVEEFSSEKQKNKEKPKSREKKKNPKDLKVKTSKTEVKDHQEILNDTIMPQTFVSTQEEEDEEENNDSSSFLADYDDKFDNTESEDLKSTIEIAKIVQEDINKLFTSICFEIDKIEVKAYNDNTLLVEFKGVDAALLIGKEGYRYKALSYMIFNWINTKYKLQLRLEIAEFLKNQEESVLRYLNGVVESVDRDGRAQTKVLDGVLVQIALKELRDIYPDKYVAIRSTREGLKYIIINDYHSN
ncbi:MAG: Jag N-terminal domain-containing protein [Campylobacterota bacterium]|nr:Jag N-terminal domain-containing protein [Campylobacterota bacterium]